MSKTDKLVLRVTPEMKDFLAETFGTYSKGFDRAVSDCKAIRSIAKREIVTAGFNEKDMNVLTDVELKAAHPSDYSNTLYYVALKHKHKAGELSDKLKQLSASARYILEKDIEMFSREQLHEMYIPD